MPEPKDGIARPATDQPTRPEAEKHPQKAKPRRVDLTPAKAVNIGYVGGVRVPETNA
jgi:hypothetical protein